LKLKIFNILLLVFRIK